MTAPSTLRIHVRFEVDVPDVGATSQEIIDWLRFMLHDNGALSADNPLAVYDVIPVLGTFQTRWP